MVKVYGMYLDAVEAWVARKRGDNSGSQRRQVDRRAEAKHGHDVAAEVRLPEQPTCRAHRLLVDGGGHTPGLHAPQRQRFLAHREGKLLSDAPF